MPLIRCAPRKVRPDPLLGPAAAYGTFYAADSVIVDDLAVKARRLMLCARTCAVMETGLRLLGIEPVERM